MFSRRVASDLRLNRISQALAITPPRFDLTVSNPTHVGISYPTNLLKSLSHSSGLTYAPDPRGLSSARKFVAQIYDKYQLAIDPDNITLTASTSEAYSFLFKLLCNPGDAILVPVPSYPLFEHLAAVEGVRTISYNLNTELGFRPDIDGIGPNDDVRAVIIVHPNNPTGSYILPEDATALQALCRRNQWALIADEVFLDYPLDGGAGSGTTFAQSTDALNFTLGGLSKTVGLPMLKLGWIVTSGPQDLKSEALARLDIITDSFLSVGTPVQLALPELLTEGVCVREQILERCTKNLSYLRECAATVPAINVLPPGGGWSAVIRIPNVLSEEELVLEILKREGVAVHPGYFFDFPREGYLVVSLLPEIEVFAEGIRRLLRQVAMLT